MISAGTDSTSTTQNQTGPLSPEGESMLSAVQGFMVQEASAAGYNMNSTPTTEYQDPSAATALQNQITDTQSQITAMQADITANPSAAGNGSPGQLGGTLAGKDPRQSQLINLENQLSQQRNQLSGMPSVTYNQYTVTKQPPAEVQAAIAQYGANSPEATQAQSDYNAQQVTDTANMASATSAYYSNLSKFMNGDLSTTDEEKQQVNALYAPVAGVISQTYDKLNTKYQDDDQALQTAALNIGKQIDQTGFDTNSALQAAGIQMDKNAQDLNTVLDQVNSSTEAKFKFQQDLLFQQIDNSVAQQAASLGLPPNSPSVVYQTAKMKNDTFTQLQLEMANENAQGKMQIEEQLTQGKQQISLAQVALAQSQGTKQEQLAGQKLAITANTNTLEEQNLQSTQQALLANEQSKQNTLYQVGSGGIPQLLGIGQSSLGFQTQQQAAQVGLAQAANQTPLGLLGSQVELQKANSTQTTTSNEGFLGAFTDVLGSLAGGAGSVLTGIYGEGKK